MISKYKIICHVFYVTAFFVGLLLFVTSIASASIMKDKATQDYTSSIQDLQITFDQIFVTLDYSSHLSSLEEPILFINPEQVISDIRREWIAEYVLEETLNNIKLKKQQLQKSENILQVKKYTKIKESIVKKAKPLVFVQAIPHKKPKLKTIYSPSKNMASLVFPVHGKVIMGFGEKDALGIKSRGLVLQADMSKDVVAPKDGIVRFAGPFGKFKQLLIVEHEDGYHSLITGFDTIDARVGEKLLVGESVGHLADTQAYYELRHNGVPIDPKKAINSL